MTAIDSATLLAHFSERLRDEGVAVSPDQTMRLATLVGLDVPKTVQELYWCARVSLLRSTADIGAFDAVFALVFRGMVDVAESRGDPNESCGTFSHRRSTRILLVAGLERMGHCGSVSRGPTAPPARMPADQYPTIASLEERLTKIDFAQLTADELNALAPLLQTAGRRSTAAAVPPAAAPSSR